ncbi:hypothetical protein ACPOL_2377 [Acidisarcina polymorpha]|uniref:Tetratricopeptide repeat protein n=1 Tax=Acidisarcina polymorpha TaxID=2211140 RepID=A0A2Z5FXT1_9BACT|nr:tetratricopeptide repeat protein [Acidisarcina polymorpha]AXC11699.1 hypothetical protein ACPOL_2377 [Acidisarcina polymorpha]
MRLRYTSLLIGVALACASGFAEQKEGTPAQQSIAAAQQQIKLDPKKVQAFNELALGLLRRSRETADAKYLKDAEAALAQGLQLAPGDFQMQRTEVALMLGRHDFAQAKERALILHHRTPDDVATYGDIAEADIALGNYPDAETNAQWMMNLRPNNIPALIAGAELRVLYGDPAGAIDFLNRASSETSPAEVEELAWIANRVASIQVESGQVDAAEQTLEQAERIFPGYVSTMENLAAVRMAQNRANDAVELLTKAAEVDSDPHVIYRLAVAEQKAGLSDEAQAKEAQASFVEFEKMTSEPGKATHEARLDLVLMEAGLPAKAPDALKLAQAEMAERQDVWTLDAYAWALFANAQYQAAEAAEQKAMAIGIRSAQIFDHAGHIAQRLNHSEDAARYFKLSIQSNPMSDYASDALKSAGTTVLAYAPEQRSVQTASGSPLEPESPDVLPRPTIASKEQAARPGEVATVAASLVFAPVPEALLTPHPTGTDRLIQSAQATALRNPNDAKAYSGLGAAYFQRARETGDVNDYQLAEQALTKSLDLVSADFSADAALGTMASVCMGEHRFNDALSYAQRGLSLGTGDVSSFAIVGDAYADMGEYDKAALAYSRLTPRDMTLEPRAAYARDSRLAYLKLIAGDTPGAILLMKTAVAEGVEAQLPSENLAWLYYELGEFSTLSGDTASANSAYMAAITIHPGDYRALAGLAKLRANHGRSAEAIGLYQRAIAVVPMPIFIAELGDLYAQTGNESEARKQYALVEYIGLLGHINQVLHNRDLALFYADHDVKLSEALELAQKELEVRHDIYTYDALAWALCKNGRLTEAADASAKALRLGTQDPLLLFHSGMIAARLGQVEKARADLEQSLHINPHFGLIDSTVAQQQLNRLGIQSASKEGSGQYAR